VKGKDLLSVTDLDYAEVAYILREAAALKLRGWQDSLRHKTLALVFEKPSLRTRVSFEVAMRQLGGESLYLSPAEIGLGHREPVRDVATVLSRFVDVIAARTFSHQLLEEFAAHSSVPVINALSDVEHPCQALADVLTIAEQKGELRGLTLTYLGDGNNVAVSLLYACVMTGINFRISCPPGYDIPPETWAAAEALAAGTGASVELNRQPEIAVIGADVLYTDVWTSMGQESETEKRHRDFAGYQLDAKLLALAAEGAIVMHPLPAHLDAEISTEVHYSPASVVWDQAENRLHVQKAVLAFLLGGPDMSPAAGA
jgi:ornithine carbamoyltransferase